MEKYRDIDGDSGISEYEIGEDLIKVKFFKTDKIYIYSHKKAGSCHVEKMKDLALRGNGLNKYINKNVRNLND